MPFSVGPLLMFMPTRLRQAIVLAAVICLAPLAPPILADDQTSLGTLGLGLRTYFFNRDRGAGRADAIATAQALRLDYSTPKLADRVTLHGSFFTSVKIDGDNGQGGTFLLRDRANGDQASYAKLGQAYVDIDLGKNTTASIGRLILDKPLLADTDKRATPSSTQAIMLETDLGDSGLYALVSDRGVTRTGTTFQRYRSSVGEDYRVYVVGATHDFGQGLSTEVSYGFADNVMHQVFGRLSFETKLGDDLGFAIDGYQYVGDAHGDGALSGVGEDYRSSVSNIAASLSYGPFRVLGSVQTVAGDRYIEAWDDSHDETEVVTEQGVYFLSFIRAGQESAQIRFDWDLGDYVDGLSLMARYVSGWNIKRSDGQMGSEWERDIDVRYKVPVVEGLSLRYRHITVRSSETAEFDENRVIINYVTNWQL